MKQKQIAVIGAGPGGLAAAVEIASKHPDDKVILIEEQNHVGGLAQAWLSKVPIEKGKYQGQTLYVRKELTHAVANMNKGGRIYEHLASLGVDMDSVPFTSTKKFAQLISLDKLEHKSLEVLNTWREMRQYLMTMAHSQKEEKQMKKYFKFIDSLIEERYHSPNSAKANLEEKLMPFLDKSFPKPLAFMGKGATLLYTKPTFVLNCFKTYEELLDGFFKDFTREEDIKATLNILFGYWGLPSQKASGLFASLVHVDYWEGGGPLAPETTSFQTLSEKIAETLTDTYNGEVLTKTKAIKVHVKDGKVSGITVKPRGKEAYDIETECVIFAGDPKRTTLPLLEGHLPKNYVKKIKNYEMSTSLTGSYILTDLPLQEMKERLDYAANVLVSSYDALNQDNEDNTPENFVYYVAIPTLREKAGLIQDREGNHIKDLHLVNIVESGGSYQRWKDLRKEDRQRYRKRKSAVITEMINTTDRLLIPGLLEHIIHSDGYTPATFDRFGNPQSGAVYSFAQTPEQIIDRPSVFIPAVKGAFMGGAPILASGVGGAIEAAKIVARAADNYLNRIKKM